MTQRAPLGGLIVLVLAGCGGADEPPQEAPRPAVVRLDVPGRPIGLGAASGGDAWVVRAADGTLTRLRLGSRPEVGESVEVGEIPLRVVSDGSATWVSVFGEGVVARVSGEARERWPRVAAEPEGLALRDGLLWVVDQAADRVLALDPGSGRVERRVPVGAGPRLVSSGASGVWVTAYDDGTVTRITASGARSSAHVCTGPQGIAESDPGSAATVWVACTGTDEVVALDARTLRERSRTPDVEAAHGVLPWPDGGALAVAAYGPTLVRIAPDGTEAARCALGDLPAVTDGNVDVLVVGEQVLVSSPIDDAVLVVPLALAEDGCAGEAGISRP